MFLLGIALDGIVLSLHGSLRENIIHKNWGDNKMNLFNRCCCLVSFRLSGRSPFKGPEKVFNRCARDKNKRSLENWLFKFALLPFLLLATATLISVSTESLHGVDHGWKLSTTSFIWVVEKRWQRASSWKQYVGSLLIFNTALFIFGFLVLALQEWMPLNPLHRPMIAPSAIF